MAEKKRVLLIDDEIELVDALKASLEENNFEVIGAYDGPTGLATARKERPDLVVLDLMLPKMDGYKVCCLLKKDLRYANIPVILFSARARDEDRQMGEEAGANAYIVKPSEFEILLSKIRELLPPV